MRTWRPVMNGDEWFKGGKSAEAFHTARATSPERSGAELLRTE
nr:hypothetical protein [Streptomyces collinus]